MLVKLAPRSGLRRTPAARRVRPGTTHKLAPLRLLERGLAPCGLRKVKELRRAVIGVVELDKIDDLEELRRAYRGRVFSIALNNVYLISLHPQPNELAQLRRVQVLVC